MGGGGDHVIHCSGCQEAIKAFQSALKPPPSSKVAISIDSRFRKQLQELRMRMGKVRLSLFPF